MVIDIGLYLFAHHLYPWQSVESSSSQPTKHAKLKFLMRTMIDGDLASRAQARLVATRFAGIKDVELDFSGIDKIDADFADELLRAWTLANTDTHVTVTNMSERVLAVVSHVLTT